MRQLLVWLVLLIPFAGNAASPATLVQNSALVVKGFAQSPDYQARFRHYLQGAHAVIIVPSFYKAGFIAGVSGGSAILVPRTGQNAWGQPAFITMQAGSVGLQAGVSAAEMVIFVMSDKGLVDLLNNRFRVGGTASIAVATVGAEIAASTVLNAPTDYIALARNTGLFAGLAIEGAGFAEDIDAATIFYGREVTLGDIIIRKKVSNGAADAVIEALKAAL
jgi:SH3 domain-containing YSC84-like protein 1